MSRTVAGIATVAMSRISGGFPFNVAKQDIGRAFELSGVKDPVARNLLSEQVWAQSTKLLPELTKIYRVSFGMCPSIDLNCFNV